MIGLIVGISILWLAPGAARAGGVQPLPPVVDADGRLGLCDVLPGGPPSGPSWAQLAANAGARVNRWEFRWDRIEPQAGTWSFDADDQAVNASLAAGIAVDGILIATPAWATAPGQRRGNGVPRGLRLPATDPSNLWASYVRGVVLHYHGQVRTWEIWNEPDLSSFWSGSSEDYYLLLKVANAVIKQIDPTATVLMAGMVAPDLGFFTRVVQDAARDRDQTGADSFDGAAWHAYGRVTLLYSNLQRLRAILAANGFGPVPIWVTEAGFPASNPNGEARQAAYLEQTVALGLAAGASRILIYRESDDAEPKSWGILSAAGEPRMGYVAFQVVAGLLAQTQAVSYDPASGVQRFVFYRPGQRVTALWTSGVAGRTVALDAGQPSGQVIDWHGSRSQAAAANGAYHLALAGASYNAGVDPSGSVVGGPPIFLVESNPPSQAAPSSFFAPLTGSQRRLVLLNQGATVATVQVAAATQPKDRITVSVASGALQMVDLDLLAGSGYAGAYSVTSSSPSSVTVAAASDRALTVGTSPATTWYAPSAPPALTLSNPSRAATQASVKLYDANGHAWFHAGVSIAAGATTRLNLPARRGTPTALVRAASAILVAGSAPLISRTDATWYLVHPDAPTVAVFNPANHAVQVDVRYVGAQTVTGQQLRLGAHHTYAVATHAAKAMVLTSGRAVAVQRLTAQGLAPAEPIPSVTSAVAAAGPATRVRIFNPSTQPAHISYTLVSPSSSVQHVVDVAPSGLSTVVARQAGGAARAVVVRSDVPVVAVAAR